MRHTNEKHRVLSCFGGGVVNGASGMLFEHIVDVLHARDLPFANDVDAFVHPADGGSKRDAIVTNFAGAFELRERFQTASSVTCSIRVLCSCNRSIRSAFNRFSAASVARTIASGEKSCGISRCPRPRASPWVTKS